MTMNKADRMTPLGTLPPIGASATKIMGDRIARESVLPEGSQERKDIPLARGCLYYFPAALAEVAKLSKAGNDKHNPGEELHHARGKSMDHADCIVRHQIDSGTIDPEDGIRHSTKVAWRALAQLQEELEAAGAPLARGARLPQPDGCYEAVEDCCGDLGRCAEPEWRKCGDVDCFYRMKCQGTECCPSYTVKPVPKGQFPEGARVKADASWPAMDEHPQVLPGGCHVGQIVTDADKRFRVTEYRKPKRGEYWVADSGGFVIPALSEQEDYVSPHVIVEPVS